MLILTRNVNQSIIIGEKLITIRILAISRQEVRIGIDAPTELSIHREELYNKIAGITTPLSKPSQIKKEPVVRTITQSSLAKTLAEIAQGIAEREGNGEGNK